MVNIKNREKIKGEYDYELIVSMESPVKWKSIGEQAFSIPTFYNPIKNKYFLNISIEDLDYYQIISDAEKDRLVMSNLVPQFLEYPKTTVEQFNINEIVNIPGVKGDCFALHLENKDYWRFLFFKEQLSEVSDFILKVVKEIGNIEESKFQIEYLGAPHDLRWYLSKYKYGRAVVSVKVLEKISDKYLKSLPHYAQEFHYDMKIPDFGNGITKTIRFSKGKCETKGLIKDQVLVRDGEVVITEDTREGITTTAYFDFEDKVFILSLESFTDYSGDDYSTSTFIMDKYNLEKLLLRIKQSNNARQNLIQIYLLSVEDYYSPNIHI